MKKILFILILAGLTALAYSQVLGGFIQTGGSGVTKGNLSTEGQSSINFNNVFGFPDSLQIAAWAHETTSRTIYVATTGNDNTGTGAVGAPYATVGKALSTINKTIDAGVTITISIGVGTFTVSATDLTVLSSISGAGTLTIQGTLTLVESGFTMGSTDANDPLKYAVSGGNTASWTTNQWKYYFLKSGSNYYPITHNTTTTISIAGEFTGTEIYQAQTILNITALFDIYSSTLNEIQFTNLEMDLTNVLHGYIKGEITSCYFKGSGNNSRISTNTSKRIRNCSFNLCKVYSNGGYINYSYFYHTGNTVSLSMLGGSYASLVLENTSTGSLSSCISLEPAANNIRFLTTSKLKIVNSYCGFFLYNKMGLNMNIPYLIVSNSTYLMRKDASVNDYVSINLLIENSIYGTPNTRWFYDNVYEFINLSSGRNIKLPGIIYPEFEQNLSASLADNATTNIIIGNKLQNRSIVLDYTIKRGTTYEVGRIKVLNDGTNLTIQEDTPLGDVGVTFAVDYNTNEIRLNCTLTSTGTGATIYYNAQRVMITPLTL